MIERLRNEITVLKKGEFFIPRFLHLTPLFLHFPSIFSHFSPRAGGSVAEMTDEQEHELMAVSEQLAQSR